MSNTLKYPLELFDETLDINSTENYDLTVEISEEGLAMAVTDLLRGKYVLWRHYPLINPVNGNKGSLGDIIGSDDFLKRHYRKVIIITPAGSSTLVPAPLFDEEMKDSYFRFNLPSHEHTEVYTNLLPFPGASVVFAPDTLICEAIKTVWPGLTPWHHTKTLLHHAFTSSRSSEERYLHLHVEKSFITLIIIDKRQLRFCNSFACSAPGDVNYFLFNIFDKAEVKNDETLHVSGNLEPYGELHISMLNFTESIKFASPQLKHNLSYVMNELHLHRWINLFTAASCE